MKKKFLTNGWQYIFVCCISFLVVASSIIVLILTKNTLDSTSYIYLFVLFLSIDIIFVLLSIYLYFVVIIDDKQLKIYHLSKFIKELKWSEIKSIEVSTRLYKFIYITTDNRSLEEKLNSFPIKDPNFMRFVYSKKLIEVINKFYKGEIIYS